MLTLYILPKQWGALSASPFSIKAIYMLNASGLDYRLVEESDPRKFPQGKLPAIEADGQIIGDSDNIRAYLVERGHDMDVHLTDQQRAEGVAWQRLAEEHLYHQIVLDRWLNETTWPLIRQAYFGSLPFPISKIIPALLRRNVRAGLTYMGHTRQSPEMRTGRVLQDLEAIKAKIRTQHFLFGDRPSSFDATLGAMLESMRASPRPTSLSATVTDDEILSAYADRVAERMGKRPAD